MYLVNVCKYIKIINNDDNLSAKLIWLFSI